MIPMSRVRSAAGAILFTYLAARAFWWVSGQRSRLLDDVWIEGLLKSVVWVVPALLLPILARRLSLHESWRELGLDASALRGYGFGLLATVPMVLALPFSRLHAIDPTVVVGTVLLGPLAEEVLFRGFLFRQLVTRARWPVGWAIGVSAVAFGLAHVHDLDREVIGQIALAPLPLHQREFVRMSLGLEFRTAGDLLLQMGTMVFILAPGGALFAWIAYRLGSLWPAIGLHACLNLWWVATHGFQFHSGFTLDPAGIAQAVSLVVALLLTLKKSATGNLENWRAGEHRD
jgi:membrane protease YdiL (CAAX protease family)